MSTLHGLRSHGYVLWEELTSGRVAEIVCRMGRVTIPYTDTYVYSQDGGPLELLRQAQGAGTATPYWYVLDGQGNVVALTNQSGSVVDSYSYDQWGRLLSGSESVPQQLRYGGTWYDNELGWYWLSVRAYDPALGRFLQQDPSELEGLFSYVYAGDNPSDLADPSGLIAAPPQSGCLETSGDFFECNVQVGSTQWNAEISGGGAKPVAGLAGAQLQALVPLLCGATSTVCQVSRKDLRAASTVRWITAGATTTHLMTYYAGEENPGDESPDVEFNPGLWLDPQLPEFATEADVKTLTDDSNENAPPGQNWRLTRANALRVLGNAPPGTTRVEIAGSGVAGGDVRFLTIAFQVQGPFCEER